MSSLSRQHTPFVRWECRLLPRARPQTIFQENCRVRSWLLVIDRGASKSFRFADQSSGLGLKNLGVIEASSVLCGSWPPGAVIVMVISLFLLQAITSVHKSSLASKQRVIAKSYDGIFFRQIWTVKQIWEKRGKLCHKCPLSNYASSSVMDGRCFLVVSSSFHSFLQPFCPLSQFWDLSLILSFKKKFQIFAHKCLRFFLESFHKMMLPIGLQILTGTASEEKCQV